MGIDQLGFQSVQLGYLKILKMGNTDPNSTKAGKRIRDIKPANQLAVISVEPLYPHSVSTGKIIGPSSSGPSAITAWWSSDTTNQSVTTLMIALDLLGTTHLSADHNVALSQPLFLTFLVALYSLQLALSIDTSLEAKSNELRNPEGPARSAEGSMRLRSVVEFEVLSIVVVNRDIC
ncbi:hypothetical protein F511_03873 [Dorcoceras hygrometricum]|nr:hypothetical protein F511_03873 [Dorcoceras hygrometricum]